jgi:4-amino-4-deoxy-L-arabinose transferase-like glycosyltransferase
MKFLRTHWLLLLILIVALVLRVYRLGATMTFLEDEGRDLLIAYRMLDTHRPVLLGPQTSTGNMYLGPLYYYFIVFPLALAGLNPLGPVIFVALTGVFTVWLLYQLGTRWFGKWTGYLAAAFYAILPLPVTFTRNSWNPNLAPLFALAVLIFVRRAAGKNHKVRNYLCLGLAAGCLVQMHYMALLYLGAVAVLVIKNEWAHWKNLLTATVWGLIGMIVALSPFIVFEIRNQYVNTQAITRFIQAKEEHNIRYELPISLWWDKVSATTVRLEASLFGRDALTPDPYRVPLTLIVLAIVFLGSMKVLWGPHKATHRLLAALAWIPLLATGIYQENIHLHYLGFLFPIWYLYVASMLDAGRRARWLYLGMLLGLSVYALPQLVSYLGSSGTNQVTRAREVAAYIRTVAGDAPYNLVSATGTHTTTPYLYFAAISAHPPTLEQTAKLFLICQGAPCSTDDIQTPFLYITGPAHPSIAGYLGHPLKYYDESVRTVISNTHVSHGAWVAEIHVSVQNSP